MASTIRDVAQTANVSIATVSRYLNQVGNVSKETAQKIDLAVKKLNYHSKKWSPRINKNKNILVIFPSITNPFYSELFSQLVKQLNGYQYSTILQIDNDMNHSIDYYIKKIKDGEISGIITSSPLKTLQHDYSDFPIVSFDRKIHKTIPIVESNNLDGGFKIAQKILSLGCKNILIISGNQMDYFPLNDRIKGMLKVFNYYGVHVKTAYTDFESSIINRKIQIAQIINNQSYDAICCTDDLTALLVKEHTHQMSYFPVITGFDGSQLVSNLFPDLLSVNQNISEIATQLINICFQSIQNSEKDIHKIIPIHLR
ncbi:LacI family transcriptional regulator [Lactobacillus mulieris]|jgi:sucrose operon repressor|uniref:LacI family DNA-binding transcriptional regulator n=1 Tax=Lactobacillus TaxID=1578 RepID=UPI00117AFABD|nr:MULTISPECIES: LacI family DNA-binding transcriptional regulator [Lactobacillus]KAA9244037.1 LacI family transcriptional regulator [Lactobacillus jensenii]MCW8124238.1 LacI family transcriptional regulator [Lactobacillus mulieris]MCZ9599402.1 LacI family transcriptional regulator [Lactobacillus mulieris]MDK7327453.1 LacI family DNA-binding transcriptional regulator [Lactobacillus mulieris]TRT38405.1 LacI family transcriptional regulator [Lactobacillus sp. c10Ua232AE]